MQLNMSERAAISFRYLTSAEQKRIGRALDTLTDGGETAREDGGELRWAKSFSDKNFYTYAAGSKLRLVLSAPLHRPQANNGGNSMTVEDLLFRDSDLFNLLLKGI